MTLLLLPLLLASLLPSSSCNKANKHKPWIEAEYQGIVMENDNTVLLNPPLFALDKDAPLRYAGEICGFRLHGSGVPFEAVILDKATGEGLIRAKEPVDCEAQKEHTFTIQAYDCGEGPDGANTKKSHKATVHVRVNDVNEFAPVFVERLYRAAVTEGKLYDRILRVEAIDGDCSPQYSQICYYEILTPNTPFLIDNDGNIENTEKLQYSGERLYKFTVTAYDCGKKRAADDAEVEIQVKPTCKPSWQGWNKRIEYAPGAGSLALFPGIRLETCDEPLWNIQATIELQTSHVAKGCDRDNYSERALRKLCGAATGEVDLLPMPGPNANWTAGLSVHYSQDSSLIYWFNGTQAVQVPLGGTAGLGSGPQDSLSDHFTLSFWMKHGVTPNKGKKEEETIVCNTVQNEDGFSHYSLTVHGCRIAFLYWPLLESARPVKFLWKLEQAATGLVRAGVQAGRVLARVRGVAAVARLCAHMLFPGMCLCVRICFAALSSKQLFYPLSSLSPALLNRALVLLQLAWVFFPSGPSGILSSLTPGLPLPPGTPPAPTPCCAKSLQVCLASLLTLHALPAVVPSAATLIIVVCVGFLVLMVILGLVRIHSLHRRVSGASGPPEASSDPKDPDLFWDDSALTIIVNPMESYQNRQACVAGAAGGPQEDEDSSDSEAADSPSSNERRIIETPPHRY
ncbi:calsyntenin-3 [Leptonychotes weddellii]|uniref:Calsyntenin-3 n=1 Tax=Leptonychotes weddellii TaxID=9713 RepID=A0A7F8R634_LEPWE|nr:calsyntenin-3 [Leptonychotes weddellii]